MQYCGFARVCNSMRDRVIRGFVLAVMLVSMMPTFVVARTYRVGDVENVQLRDRTRFVSNPDGILSRDAVATLDSICYSLKERGIAEVAIVAVRNIEPRDPFSFAQSLFERWGVGDDDLDNGLGVLLVEDMREIRFHTGYGLEGVLPDVMCVRIQEEYMLPYFRDGDYSEGMVAGMRAVDVLLTDGELPIAEDDDEGVMWLALFLVLFGVLLPLLFVVRHEYIKTKCPTCGKHKLRVVERTTTATAIIERLVCDSCHSEHTRTTQRDNHQGSRRGGGLWIFPMGGGFGGGGGSFGGGFGGGSFGGGGGGSRW